MYYIYLNNERYTLSPWIYGFYILKMLFIVFPANFPASQFFTRWVKPYVSHISGNNVVTVNKLLVHIDKKSNRLTKSILPEHVTIKQCSHGTKKYLEKYLAFCGIFPNLQEFQIHNSDRLGPERVWSHPLSIVSSSVTLSVMIAANIHMNIPVDFINVFLCISVVAWELSVNLFIWIKCIGLSISECGVRLWISLYHRVYIWRLSLINYHYTRQCYDWLKLD